MIKRQMEFKHTLPFHLEQRLIHKLGWYIQHRQFQESITVGKNVTKVVEKTETIREKIDKIIDGRSAPNVVNMSENKSQPNVRGYVAGSRLTKFVPPVMRCKDLERQCDNIVGFFNDPFNSTVQVRQRLVNISINMDDEERQYVQDYMDENFPIEGKTK